MKKELEKILKEYQHIIPQLDGVTNDLVITDDQFDDVIDDIVNYFNGETVKLREGRHSDRSREIDGIFNT